MVTIAVDAMGGDHAPAPEVHGAVRAARSQDVNVILVGKEDVLKAELSKYDSWRNLPIRIVHASEVVTMGTTPPRLSGPSAIPASASPPVWSGTAKPTDLYRRAIPARSWQWRRPSWA